MTDPMVLIRAWGSIGLARKSSAPVASAARRSTGKTLPETTTERGRLAPVPSSFTSCRPSPSGSPMSSRIRSTCCAASVARAAASESATSTSAPARSGAEEPAMMARINSWFAGSSSTTRIVRCDCVPRGSCNRGITACATRPEAAPGRRIDSPNSQFALAVRSCARAVTVTGELGRDYDLHHRPHGEKRIRRSADRYGFLRVDEGQAGHPGAQVTMWRPGHHLGAGGRELDRDPRVAYVPLEAWRVDGVGDMTDDVAVEKHRPVLDQLDRHRIARQVHADQLPPHTLRPDALEGFATDEVGRRVQLH